MRAKAVLNVALGAFVVLALILVARQSIKQRSAVPPKVEAAAVAAARVTTTARNAPAVAVKVDDAKTAEPGATAISRDEESPPAVPAREPERAVRKKAPAMTLSSPPHKVIAMYFHGDIRCMTCRKVEAYAREAVEEGFASQVKAGAIEFRAVNVEQPENRHFISDYQLTNKSVVVVDEVGGNVERWVKLDNVWGLVGNREAYLQYVQDAVRAYSEN